MSAFSDHDRDRCIRLYGFDPEQSLLDWLAAMVDDPAALLAAVEANPTHLLDAKEPQPIRLTQREAQVVRLQARGLTMSEIAEVLSLSTETVRTFAKHAQAKLGAHNTAHAVAIFTLLDTQPGGWQEQPTRGKQPRS